MRLWPEVRRRSPASRTERRRAIGIRCRDVTEMGRVQPVRYRVLVHDSARWQGFVFRPDDIVISTPAKCGTTWTQMICALLIFQTPDLDQPLSMISPWLDMLTRAHDDVVADLDAQTHRRFIKTHTPLDGLPYDPRITYLCVGRDPRDVALSMDNHWDNMATEKFIAARERAVGLEDVAEQLASQPRAPPRRANDSGHGSTTTRRRTRRPRRSGERFIISTRSGALATRATS